MSTFTPFAELVADRRFRRLLVAFTTSRAGDFLYSVALTVALIESTGSLVWVSAAWLARLLPMVLLSPFVGVIGDRFDRRHVLVWCDSIRAGVMVLLAMGVVTGLPGGWLVLLVAMAAVAGIPGPPTFFALVAEVVPDERLPEANSAVSAVTYGALAVGPAAGSVLLLVGSPELAIAINAASFLTSAILIARLPIGRALQPVRTAGSAEAHLGSTAHPLAAARMVMRDRLCLSAILVLGLSTVTLGFMLVAAVALSDQVLGTGTAGVGWLDASLGIGGVLGAPLAARFACGDRSGRVLALSSVLCNVPVAVLAVVTHCSVAYVLLLASGVASVVLDVAASTAFQRRMPASVLAGVEGICGTSVYLGMLAGTLLAPVLISFLGLEGAVLVAGIVPAVAGLLVVLFMGREVHRPAPAARWLQSETLASLPA